MQTNKGAFHSILAILYFNEQKNNKTFNGDYAKRLPFLEMTEGIYHISFVTFKGVVYYDKKILIKRFTHELFFKIWNYYL